MKKIDVSKKLESLNGEDLKNPQNPIEVLTIGKTLAMILINHQGKKFEAFKLWDLAKRFYESEGEVEIDNSDFLVLRQIVNEDKNFNALVLGQVVSNLMDIEISNIPQMKHASISKTGT